MKESSVDFYYERNECGEDLYYDFATSRGNIYFHGDLELELGHDMPYYSKDKLPEKEGIYPANVNDNSGYTLYFWFHKLNEKYTQLRGLIVKDTDVESAKYALTKFNERAEEL